MAGSKLDYANARVRRGEELRLALILGVLKAGLPLKVAKLRKPVTGGRRRQAARHPEPVVA